MFSSTAVRVMGLAAIRRGDETPVYLRPLRECWWLIFYRFVSRVLCSFFSRPSVVKMDVESGW